MQSSGAPVRAQALYSLIERLSAAVGFDFGKSLPILFCAALILLITIGLILLCIQYTKRKRAFQPLQDESIRATPSSSNEQENSGPLSLASPLSGRVIPLSEVNDPAISAGLIGNGCAILPEEGKLYAPFDGIVSAVWTGHHAITIDSKDGVELFIHVGKDTARLEGKYFDLCCKAGDQVKKGDLLLSFDPDAIRKDGYDLTTPLLVINFDQFDDLRLTCECKVAPGDRLFSFTKRREPPLTPPSSR